MVKIKKYVLSMLWQNFKLNGPAASKRKKMMTTVLPYDYLNGLAAKHTELGFK